MLHSLFKYYNYFFYSIYRWYVSQGEKRIPGHYAILFISTIFSLNILSLFLGIFLLLLKISEENINGIKGALVFISLCLLNYYYFYYRKGKENAIKLFESYDVAERKKMRRRIRIYCVTSVLIIIILLYIYFNS